MKGTIRFHRIGSALAALFLSALASGCVANDTLATDALPVSSLTIKTADGRQHAVEVEVAADPGSRETGLMHRKAMPAGHGMLFVFPKPRRVTMWMKDTLLPLDMIFIDRDETVSRIRHDAVPMDESIIDSGGEVLYVLEMNAGYARREGIGEGARVSGPALDFRARQ